ncbi:hypothetical protein FOCG_08938 [Fusarium oxysporum f. sp. radicis-lycopersici 26381]|uniref:Uncharacterized protein n=1 Tax=Fusarium oxysporum Fo47 TaxID=660027 RepID=W9KCQ4_FUSOX|nr:hypothetical protein FOZG_08343 [Fusarium oxysporum Fo47]EXL50724.1 hypothetical protein FOCG_08938 [Fusarium oxysporum f. sp. radicis-lycopersici 26381]
MVSEPPAGFVKSSSVSMADFSTFTCANLFQFVSSTVGIGYG